MRAREEIMNAAEELFGEAGFDGATTREISRGSGVNQGLIYYYFGNKQALFESVLDRYFLELERRLLYALEEEGEMADRLSRVLDTYMDFLQANSAFSRIIQREASGGRHMELIYTRLAPIFERGLELIKQAYPATRKGEMSADQILLSFYAMIAGYFTFGPMMGRLLETDPMAKSNFALRKQHLKRMLEIVTEAVNG